jgi:Mrp family chromosome partitioning ATPase
MSRMLEALKQIEASSPAARPAIQPISPEELEAFGVRPPPEPPPTPEAADDEVVPLETAGHGAPAAPPTEPDHDDAARVGGTANPPPSVKPTGNPSCRPISLPDDAEKGAYGDLAGRILAQVSQRSGNGPAVLMFASVTEGEYTSVTLASLAVVLAGRTGDPIVAVNADFRDPALANRLGIRADQGLADALATGADLGELVRKTSVDGLSVLPWGRPPAAGFSLDPAKLDPVLQSLRRQFRLVLLDAPCVMHPAIAPISRLCDGTYLLVKLGRTGRNAARRAVRLVDRCGGRPLGCVLVER